MSSSTLKRDYDFDLAVVGGGSGGYAAARTAASAGLRTVVIEGAAKVGGLCILRGCMPTKALLYAAEVRHLALQRAAWGMDPGDAPFRWQAVRARKDQLIREFADYRVQQLESGAFQFIRARARFEDPHTLVLDSGGRLTAASVVLSTGSVVAPPPLPALERLGYLTSDEALELETLPRSMIVLGGGAVAVEFAQIFARFGVEVTLIQRNAQLLKEADSDAAAALSVALARDGIRLFTGARLIDAQREKAGRTITIEQEGRRIALTADEVLFALGRAPNTASLDLGRAGVETDHGRILTNDQMQTSAPHIYAAGDCTGPHELVHIAIQQGEIAAHNITGPERRRRIDYRLLLNVVFTEPQVATVGLTAKEAERQGVPFVAASYPFGDHGKSIIMEARDGFVKLLASPQTGEILGGCCVGPAAGELIHEIAVAMAGRMTVHQLASIPHYHPTLAEIWTYPAEELAGRISGQRVGE